MSILENIWENGCGRATYSKLSGCMSSLLLDMNFSTRICSITEKMKEFFLLIFLTRLVKFLCLVLSHLEAAILKSSKRIKSPSISGNFESSFVCIKNEFSELLLPRHLSATYPFHFHYTEEVRFRIWSIRCRQSIWKVLLIFFLNFHAVNNATLTLFLRSLHKNLYVFILDNLCGFINGLLEYHVSDI